jgi:hypothetical protein
MEIVLTDPTSHQVDGAIHNLGDVIIKEAIVDNLQVASKRVRWIPLAGAGYHPEKPGSGCLVLAGANVLANNPFFNPWVWKPSLGQCAARDYVVLCGVGWWQYQRRFGPLSRAFYRRVLLPTPVLHSVRDGYTAQMLGKSGLDNVLNTGCPTMWRLPERMSFGSLKPDRVVFTLTDYSQDPPNDRALVQFALRTYDDVTFFPQGSGDVDYLRSLGVGPGAERILFLDRTLADYDDCLESGPVDYVGTRLHGGIRALQKGRRAFVLIVDNRAAEIARDTGLRCIPRSDLDRLTAGIHEDFELSLRLDRSAVRRFLEAFERYVSEDASSIERR